MRAQVSIERAPYYLVSADTSEESRGFKEDLGWVTTAAELGDLGRTLLFGAARPE